MKRIFAAACIVVATLAAAPGPDSNAGRLASVVCDRTPLFTWPKSESRPARTRTDNDAVLGQRFTVLSGPRATTDSRLFLELDIPVVETGYGPSEHYWIVRDCVGVTDAPTPAPAHIR